ncbi:hypothetical protein BDW59DRAFT_84854 [Aspergillus cavernicola]|uniref:Uncharacterized protein n=1 Tax=Aspergillus cavernicola TaxID=176166 RepID=A0ABR4ICJ6_9EURO
MPRPAAKRNRLATKTLGISKQNQGNDLSRDNVGSRDISRSPRSDAVGSSRLGYTADPSEIIRQLRNQTPLGKAQEFAIGSSPGTEHGGTGSRPATRARGYSSTLSIAGRKGDASSRIPGTPAFESSILSNFRRRPRQASILHMMQDEDGSSDYDDDDFLGGLSPEDESTPLNISRGKSLVLRPAVSSPTKASSPSSGKSPKRKRSVEEVEVEVPQSPPHIASSAPGSPSSESESEERDISVNLPRLPQSSAAFSETMAPPMSSPMPSLTHEMSTPDSDRLTSRTKKSRNSKAKQRTDSKIHVPTAALQDRLLPRRRQRRIARLGASGFEVLSESDDDELPPAAQDEDELGYLPLRKRPETRRKPASKPKALTKNRAQQEGGKKTNPGRDPKIAKQYGVNKENGPVDMSSPLSSALESEDFDSDFLLEQEAPVKTYLSDELRYQAAKFAEVDRWQMEFEDVVTVGTQENGTFR